MPGTVEIIDDSPHAGSLGGGRRVKFTMWIDGAVRSESFGMPGKAKVDVGDRTVRVSISGYRTNTVTVAVAEGAYHAVRIAPNGGRAFMRIPLLGIPYLLIALLVPGLRWRAEYSPAPEPQTGP
jgi:hypothetical protein